MNNRITKETTVTSFQKSDVTAVSTNKATSTE